MKPIQVNQVPHKSYTFGGASALVDGISGSNGNYKDGSWIGFNQGDIEIIIDLKKETEISQIEFNTYVCTGDWIFGAKGLTVSISDDDKNYKIISEALYSDPDKHIEKVELNKATFLSANTRYVKLNIFKVNKMPHWHAGASTPAFIFID